ncbi:aminotransferase class I/II-fold pyridoxal phosphate-dependent enzyme [Streptomyces sp. NPDC002055]|uniref:aminotransferase class I/II-fold pyridoxal phosphate-dependent enzyme n=1 Tax=Streptomyces sp. NPDC002055 TaxID=3154534 RepID=UPI0033170119
MPGDQLAPRRILVTGVGANPGFGLTRSLTRLGHEVVAADSNPLAPGFLLPGVVPQVIPLAADPGYCDRMAELCRRLAVDAVVAGIENDLPPLVSMAPCLDAAGARLWLPDAGSVSACIDKAAFHQVLTEHGIPTPRTWWGNTLDQVPDGTELVVKPRRGHGAQGVHYCDKREHALFLSELVSDALVQERIYGTEFTADCLVDRSACASVILRRRNLVKAGLATVSTTFHDTAVQDLVQATLRAVRAEGLCCVQGFITVDGAVTITELNVRVAGGFPLSEAAGADLVGQMVRGLFGMPVDHNRLTYQAGMFLTNYVETLAVGNAAELERITASERGTVTATRPDAGRNASPYLYGEEAAAVASVLESGQYGHTDVTQEFERRIAAYLGVPDAVAVTSGTAALHSALLVAGIGPGAEVIVPSLTFCATIQVIRAVGATPRFVDIDPATLCVTPQLVMEAVSDATAAVVPVLFGGRAIDLGPVQDALTERGIVVIEDAAHAFGSRNGPRHVGASGTALTCFSFGPIKNLTCGQGGMVIPRTGEEADAIRRIRLLGVAQSQSERANTTTYRVDGFGLRYQLSAINSAIGLAQLSRFATTVRARRGLWRSYRDALSGLDGVTLIDVGAHHAVPHLCQVRVPHRDEVFSDLRAQGVGVGVHYPPNHLQPAFAAWRRTLPATERVAAEILSLPFHQHLTETDIDHVVSALGQALKSAGAS